MGMEMSIPKLMDLVPNDEAAYRFLEDLRWGDSDPACPHCGSVAKHYFLNPKNPEGRKTRTGKPTVRRVWKCRDCRKQFSVLTGTIFHGTKISIRTWVMVVFEMCASKNGVASREIERKYDLTPRSAWYMLQRIREAMADDDADSVLSGIVTADETFIGPNPKNLQAIKRHAQDRPYRDKTAVLSLVERESGRVRSRVVPNVKAATLKDAILKHVDLPNTVLHTAQAPTYTKVGWKAAEHHSVNHALGEYVRGNVTTNHAEGYFSQLKRSLDGTYHHVSTTHLTRYLSEFDYRWSSRKVSDSRRVERLMGRVAGRRLTYDELTGRSA
jgi:transposase-like protein